MVSKSEVELTIAQCKAALDQRVTDVDWLRFLVNKAGHQLRQSLPAGSST